MYIYINICVCIKYIWNPRQCFFRKKIWEHLNLLSLSLSLFFGKSVYFRPSACRVALGVSVSIVTLSLSLSLSPSLSLSIFLSLSLCLSLSLSLCLSLDLSLSLSLCLSLSLPLFFSLSLSLSPPSLFSLYSPSLWLSLFFSLSISISITLSLFPSKHSEYFLLWRRKEVILKRLFPGLLWMCPKGVVVCDCVPPFHWEHIT